MDLLFCEEHLLLPLMVWVHFYHKREVPLQINAKFFWLIICVLGCGLFQEYSAPSIGCRGSWNSLMGIKIWKIMYLIWDGLHSHQISTHLNTHERFWSDMQGSTFHLHHQNTKWVNIFWENGVYHTYIAQVTCGISASAQWTCSGDLWWPNTLLVYFMLVFPLIFGLFVGINI